MLAADPSLVSAIVPNRGLVVTLGCVLAGVIAVALSLGRGAIVANGRHFQTTWPAVTVLSAATLLGHVAMFVVAARVAGVPAPVMRLVPLMVLTLIVMGLPLNIGGWGPREGFAALAFGAVGLGAASGVSTAVVYGVLALVASLPGVVVLLVRADIRGRTRPARRAQPCLSGPRQGMDGRLPPIRSRRPDRVRGGGDDRRPASRPVRSPA